MLYKYILSNQNHPMIIIQNTTIDTSISEGEFKSIIDNASKVRLLNVSNISYSLTSLMKNNKKLKWITLFTLLSIQRV